MPYNFPEEEQKILKFWQENKIFEKLREKNKKGKPWSFLDGPITANNPMGVHHAWGRTYKDLLQRYHAMKGFNQRYQNGFDCQGLWVEVEVEKELGFKNKKDIEQYGIDKFIEKCKERVKKYSDIQTQQSIRLGQWMDWENSYYTMSDENNYAIWHFLKKCWQLGYLYKGRDSVPWCPRCGTAISQHEISTEEYKEVVHDSIYFRLPIVGRKNEYLLVWTTTPWTLPANIAVAVDKNLDYSLVQDSAVGGASWVIKDLVEKIFNDNNNPLSSSSSGQNFSKAKILKTAKGKELVGLKYSFAFDDLPRVKELVDKCSKNQSTNFTKVSARPSTHRNECSGFQRVIATDDRIMPINIEEGTGLVHTAVSAGQEDFKLGQKLGLPLIEVIDEEANYIDGLGEFSGKNAKKHPEIILDYLFRKQPEVGRREDLKQQWVFRVEKYKHRYPACWRCKTELVWRVVDEWYISMDSVHGNSKSETINSNQVQSSKLKVQSLRKKLVEIAKKINWIPEFGLDRELDWLKNMHDWLISKKRYWGLALPIFECQECGNFEVIGSKEELQKRAVEGWDKFNGNSPHRPWVDAIKIKCKKCKKLVSRIKDVGNPWLDAGIVPFSTIRYFSDKPYWKKWFPAQIVTESFPGQFKNWFYSLLVMSAVLEDNPPIKTIFGYASVKDERGEEMHKSKGNAIWFDDAVEKIGADPMRWMYMRHNPSDNFNFGYTAGDEIKRKLLILSNVYIFFTTYVKKEEFPLFEKSGAASAVAKNVLDRWIISKTNHLISVVEFNLDKYDVAKAVLLIENFFVDDLSLWYIRRSRKRFHSLAGDPEQSDRKESIETLYYVLLNVTKLIAPVMPFFAEQMYQLLRSNLKSVMPESAHLCDWPETGSQTDLDLEQKMDEVRSIVSLGLAERSAKEIKIRQPLASLKIKDKKLKIKDNNELLDLIKDEINVKEIIFDDKIKGEVELDTNITKELEEEGIIRDIVRYIQDNRKENGMKPDDRVLIALCVPKMIKTIIDKNREFLLRDVKADEILVELRDVLEEKAPNKKSGVENKIYSISIKKV